MSRLASFADLFTRPTWSNVLVLVAGVVLAPGRRTVTAALRILGRDRDPAFCTFHRILNRAAWSSRAAAGRLLILLIKAFVTSSAPVVIGLDDTIERRWGAKINARGIYRDPVRSSKGHFGLGSSGRPANPPLASRPLYCPGRRQRICSHRIPRRRPQPCLRRYPPAPRRQPVRLPAAKAQRTGSAADQGQASEKALRHPHGSQSLLEALSGQSLVRPKQPPRRDRYRNRAVVSRRGIAGADPLAAGPRSHA